MKMSKILVRHPSLLVTQIFYGTSADGTAVFAGSDPIRNALRLEVVTWVALELRHLVLLIIGLHADCALCFKPVHRGVINSSLKTIGHLNNLALSEV